MLSFPRFSSLFIYYSICFLSSLSSARPAPAPAPALLIPKQSSNNHIKRLLLHFISAFYLSVSSYRDTIVQLHTESLYNYIQYNCTIVSGAILRLYNQLSADCISYQAIIYIMRALPVV